MAPGHAHFPAGDCGLVEPACKSRLHAGGESGGNPASRLAWKARKGRLRCSPCVGKRPLSVRGMMLAEVLETGPDGSQG